MLRKTTLCYCAVTTALCSITDWSQTEGRFCVHGLCVCPAVCCEVLRRWDWGKRWSPSLEEEHGASPVRRTTSTRTLKASCASLRHRSVSVHTHTHTPVCKHAQNPFQQFTLSSCSLQERQSIIKYWLDNLRAKHGEVLHNINFLEGQPISKLHHLSVW